MVQASPGFSDFVRVSRSVRLVGERGQENAEPSLTWGASVASACLIVIPLGGLRMHNPRLYWLTALMMLFRD